MHIGPAAGYIVNTLMLITVLAPWFVILADVALNDASWETRRQARTVLMCGAVLVLALA
jgi:hypothetical protein